MRTGSNMQLDGRPLSYNEIIVGDSERWDVEQVEVLRGAQSTLQSRNAMPGTIATKTNDPTFDSEGALHGGGGHYDQRRVSGRLSGPVLAVFGDRLVPFRRADARPEERRLGKERVRQLWSSCGESDQTTN